MTLFQVKNSFISNYLINSQRSVDCDNSGDFKRFSNASIRDVYPSGFHNLPVNVLLSIFMYLDEKELRKSVIPVCYKWRQVALLPDLWRKVKFEGLHIPHNFICQQLRSLTNLQCVYFVNIPNAATVIRQLCRCNPQIITIAIKNCTNDETQNRFPERVLRNLVASCRKLQEINLKGTPFYGNIFYLEVAVLPELKSINLSNNEFLNTKNIFELVLNCQQLEELKLSYRNKNQQLSDSDAVFLFSNLKSTLKSITFDTMDLSDMSFKTLLECEKLEKLYLYNATNMSPETFQNIWKKLPDLKYLKIHHSQINSEQFVSFFTEGKDVLRNLKILNLSDSWKLNAEGIKAISECCLNLEKAVFKNCKSLDSVDPLLQNCKRLVILNLAFCTKLTDDSLIEIPSKLPQLKALYLDNNRRSVINCFTKQQLKLDVYICLSEFNKKLEKVK